MKTSLLHKFHHGIAALPLLCTVGLVGLLLPSLARASCTLIASSASVDLGRTTVGALAPAEQAGYRKMGSRIVTLTGNCEASQTDIRLAFDNLQPVAGKALVQWGTGGAIAFRVERASVGGVAVPLRVAAGAPAVYVSGWDLTQDSVIELDLSRIPPDARKAFTLQVSLTGLLPERFAPVGQTRLDGRFSARLIDAR